MEKEDIKGRKESVAEVHMVRSEKQERSDIVYIELDGRESGWRKDSGTHWDGKRRRTEEGTGWQGGRQGWAGDAVGTGGCRRTARVECERERVGIAGGSGGRGEKRLRSNGAMSVCTRTPSRPRRWRNVATQPHRERRPHRAAPDPFSILSSASA